MQFSPSPIPLVLRDKFHPEILTGPSDLASKNGGCGKTALCVNIAKTVRDCPNLLLMINRKLHTRFDLHQDWLPWTAMFEFSRNFAWSPRFRRQEREPALSATL